MFVPKDLIVIDIETTGLEPDDYSVCQIGIAIADKETLTAYKTYESLVRPLEDSRFPPAMVIHGIAEKELNQAPSLGKVLMEMEALIDEPENYRLASWGIYFDIAFLKKQYEKIKRPYPFHYESVDIRSIVCWEMCKKDLVPKRWGLESMHHSLGFKFEGQRHSALADALGALRLLKHVSK
jgi:inhibitor of KinA sporulation pathway (predicted exonuclease)